MKALPILFCIGLVAGPSTAASAAPSSKAHVLAAMGAMHTMRPDRVEITVDPSVGDIEVMDRWMQTAADQGMQAADVTAQDVAVGRTLVIQIEGSLLAYEYFVGVRTPDGWATPVHRASCSCKDQELIERVREAIAASGPQLRGRAPEVSPAATPLRPARRLGPAGIVGATLVGVGGGALIGGVVMLALRPEWSIDGDRPRHEQGKTLRLPGGILAGAGAAFVAVGAVLLHRDLKKRRATIAPTAGRRGIGVTAVVRF